MLRCPAVAGALLWMVACHVAAQAAGGLASQRPLPDRADVAGLPQFDQVQITPDGEHLLLLQSDGEYYQVVIQNINTGARWQPLQDRPNAALINWCQWANNERVVCSLRSYKSVGRAGKVTFTRLVGFNRDGSNFLLLVPKGKVNILRGTREYNPQVQDRVLAWMPHDPEHVMLQLNRDRADRPGVYRLNIYTNDIVRVHKPRGRVKRWFADHRGAVRMALGYRRGSRPVLYQLRGRLFAYDEALFASEVPPAPVGFPERSDQVFMSMTHGSDRHGIFRVSLETGEVLEEIYVDPELDVFGGLILHPESGEPVGVRFTRHHPEVVWFDEQMERMFASIDQLVPGEHMELVSSDHAYNRFVFYSYGGVSPGYYLLHRETGRLELIGKDYPQLDDSAVADLQPVTFPTRDGLRIPGYLALPPELPPRNLPLVVMPHGGPYERDTARFDSWVQYLTDMGIAVLKPNYRGSVGYGEEFMRAGFKQWGEKMQDDLADGIDWLAGQGLVDRSRVCVVGASYGGYTALVSSYKQAEKVRCAASLAGISNLKESVQRIYSFDLVQRNRSRIQPDRELRANSPLHQAEHVQIPVLLVHGDHDSVVLVKHGRQMASALARHKKDFRYIEQKDGDHFLSRGSQRTEFFEALGGFLNQHLLSTNDLGQIPNRRRPSAILDGGR